MCRYGLAGPYKEKWACFNCRKSFKQTSELELDNSFPLASDAARQVHCPQCRRPMHDMGLDFKAPPERDKEQWRKVELLLAHGYRYSSCGCNGPGPGPLASKKCPHFSKTNNWQRSSGKETRAFNFRPRNSKPNARKAASSEKRSDWTVCPCRKR